MSYDASQKYFPRSAQATSGQPCALIDEIVCSAIASQERAHLGGPVTIKWPGHPRSVQGDTEPATDPPNDDRRSADTRSPPLRPAFLDQNMCAHRRYPTCLPSHNHLVGDAIA